MFFFQAEDGIRDAQESRGLGDVYKRQEYVLNLYTSFNVPQLAPVIILIPVIVMFYYIRQYLSLIHI